MPSAGKVLELLTHPAELRAVVNTYIWREMRDIKDPAQHQFTGYDRASMRRCWEFLDLTSRSFSMVIKELEGDLARVVCIFYLVLRALDTVEDDMTVPNSVKLPLLRSFHEKLYEPGWNFNGSGPAEKDRQVLVEFEVVQEEFARLDEKYQKVIAKICANMGKGMADFAALATPSAPVAEVNTIEDYDLYCHYVAGLVGEGLSGLFASSGKEREWLADQLTLSNSMGLLLQKTNILRDIREDVDEGRGFWPRAIWGKHGFNSQKELTDPARQQEAMWAASEMTLDALRHTLDALDYMTLLKNQSVFNFVAIPAVMAIATLDRCFMNPDILVKNVKIRRGEAIMLINRAVNPRDVGLIFQSHARSIHSKVHKSDPNLLKLSIACARIEQWTEHHYPSFLQLSSTGGGGFSIDPSSSDARAPMYAKMMAAAQDRIAAEKRQAVMDDLVARGIIRDPKAPIEYEEVEEVDAEGNTQVVKRAKNVYPDAKNRVKEDDLSYTTLILVVLGVIGATLGVAGGIIYVIVKYSD